jgi:hypothetical protein
MRVRSMPRRLLAPFLGLSVLGATFLIPAATFAAATTCDAGPWPASVQGVPLAYHSGARAGDYIWHSSTGWHVRVTHITSSKLAFSGRIVANAPMTVAPVRLEKGDVWAISADKKTVTYHFANYGNVDGLDIKTACATRIAFRGSMSGSLLPIGRIWIGRAGHHPLQNPFAVTR